MRNSLKLRKIAVIAGMACVVLSLTGWGAADSKPAAEISQSVVVGNSQFMIRIADGNLNVSRAQLHAYVRDAAKAVIKYYGFFPVAKTIVQIVPSDDDGVGFGTSTHDDANGVGMIEIHIGESATNGDLQQSWTLTHELMHLGFPVMDRKHRWLAEGIATYVEPIGRMRIGRLTKEEVWGDLYKNLHRGLPLDGEGGLNQARSFGRIYWGGALYCLLADIEIRKRTDNRLGLEDALRNIAKQGGTAASDWSAFQAINAGDKSVGGSVLSSLYESMADAPKPVNLQVLMKQLGVKRVGDKIAFDEGAPLAHIRRAIDAMPDAL